jgi:hypothetical protein
LHAAYTASPRPPAWPAIDVAAPALGHPRDQRAGQHERRGQVDLHEARNLRLRHRRELARPADPGVVDEHVHPAVHGLGGRRQLPGRAGLGQVGHERGAADAPSRLLGALEIRPRGEDVRAPR